MLQANPNTMPSSGYNPRSITSTALTRKKARAKKKFLKWLNRNHPDVLKRALDRAGLSKSQVGLSGLGQDSIMPMPSGGTTDTTSTTTTDDDAPWYEKAFNMVGAAAETYLGYEQQKELIKINQQRAEQGLPPLDQPPSIVVQGEAGPETRRAVQEGIMGAAGQYVPLVLGGLVLFVLMQKGGGSKRKR